MRFESGSFGAGRRDEILLPRAHGWNERYRFGAMF
jgi:hypothetical protein